MLKFVIKFIFILLISLLLIFLFNKYVNSNKESFFDIKNNSEDIYIKSINDSIFQIETKTILEESIYTQEITLVIIYTLEIKKITNDFLKKLIIRNEYDNVSKYGYYSVIINDHIKIYDMFQSQFENNETSTILNFNPLSLMSNEIDNPLVLHPNKSRTLIFLNNKSKPNIFLNIIDTNNEKYNYFVEYLKNLVLTNCKIDTINLDNLIQLEFIDLSYNSLSVLDLRVVMSGNLEKIIANNNSITNLLLFENTLSDAIKNNPSIELTDILNYSINKVSLINFEDSSNNNSDMEKLDKFKSYQSSTYTENDDLKNINNLIDNKKNEFMNQYEKTILNINILKTNEENTQTTATNTIDTATNTIDTATTSNAENDNFKNINDFTVIQYIDVSNNLIQNELNFTRFTLLKYLDVSNNKISIIYLLDNFYLEYLNLSNNNYKKILLRNSYFLKKFILTDSNYLINDINGDYTDDQYLQFDDCYLLNNIDLYNTKNIIDNEDKFYKLIRYKNYLSSIRLSNLFNIDFNNAVNQKDTNISSIFKDNFLLANDINEIKNNPDRFNIKELNNGFKSIITNFKYKDSLNNLIFENISNNEIIYKEDNGIKYIHLKFINNNSKKNIIFNNIIFIDNHDIKLIIENIKNNSNIEFNNCNISNIEFINCSGNLIFKDCNKDIYNNFNITFNKCPNLNNILIENIDSYIIFSKKNYDNLIKLNIFKISNNKEQNISRGQILDLSIFEINDININNTIYNEIKLNDGKHLNYLIIKENNNLTNIITPSSKNNANEIIFNESLFHKFILVNNNKQLLNNNNFKIEQKSVHDTCPPNPCYDKPLFFTIQNKDKDIDKNDINNGKIFLFTKIDTINRNANTYLNIKNVKYNNIDISNFNYFNFDYNNQSSVLNLINIGVNFKLNIDSNTLNQDNIINIYDNSYLTVNAYNFNDKINNLNICNECGINMNMYNCNQLFFNQFIDTDNNNELINYIKGLGLYKCSTINNINYNSERLINYFILDNTNNVNIHNVNIHNTKINCIQFVLKNIQVINLINNLDAYVINSIIENCELTSNNENNLLSIINITDDCVSHSIFNSIFDNKIKINLYLFLVNDRFNLTNNKCSKEINIHTTKSNCPGSSIIYNNSAFDTYFKINFKKSYITNSKTISKTEKSYARKLVISKNSNLKVNLDFHNINVDKLVIDDNKDLDINYLDDSNYNINFYTNNEISIKTINITNNKFIINYKNNIYYFKINNLANLTINNNLNLEYLIFRKINSSPNTTINNNDLKRIIINYSRTEDSKENKLIITNNKNLDNLILANGLFKTGIIDKNSKENNLSANLESYKTRNFKYIEYKLLSYFYNEEYLNNLNDFFTTIENLNMLDEFNILNNNNYNIILSEILYLDIINNKSYNLLLSHNTNLIIKIDNNIIFNNILLNNIFNCSILSLNNNNITKNIHINRLYELIILSIIDNNLEDINIDDKMIKPLVINNVTEYPNNLIGKYEAITSESESVILNENEFYVNDNLIVYNIYDNLHKEIRNKNIYFTQIIEFIDNKITNLNIKNMISYYVNILILRNNFTNNEIKINMPFLSLLDVNYDYDNLKITLIKDDEIVNNLIKYKIFNVDDFVKLFMAFIENNEIKNFIQTKIKYKSIADKYEYLYKKKTIEIINHKNNKATISSDNEDNKIITIYR